AAENNGISDGKPFRRQLASFRPAEIPQSPISFYGHLPYPADLQPDFEVLRVNEVGRGGALKLVDPRYKLIHFIDENPSTASDPIVYEVIFGNPEQFLRPRFEFPINNVPLLLEKSPQAGVEIARIIATSPSRSKIQYEMYDDSGKTAEYFAIDADTGQYFCRAGFNACIHYREL
ncbi:unnamed protein product, partial [Gongylonema pulchrum]|uniref:Cadherin domain-containing protein n=1 Tax=Gongylonema pulchrum TaxID=637853 RepID=A0A183D7I6_9BILA